MTGQATFGEFLHAARQQIETPSGVNGQAGRHDVFGVSYGLARVVGAMRQYVEDITAPYRVLSSGKPPPPLTAWARAGVEAREALITAARFLPPQRSARRSASRSASELAQQLDSAGVWLVAGRDLLQTHFTVGTGGTRQPRSEWAAVVSSPAATRALLGEIGALAQRIAPRVADLALTPTAGGTDTTEARRRLNAACQWLWALNASVRAAHEWEPVTSADRELLHAIPVNSVQPRRLPEGSESVAVLCDGAIVSAERVRHLVWGNVQRAAWSPVMSTASLHQVAAVNTVTSHNCQVLLHTLAAGTSDRAVGEQLLEAAEAAGRARDAWRRLAGAVDQVATDSGRRVSPVAVEARDLAVWTGRLAYAEPGWTPATGPSRPARPPRSLVPEPEQMPLVIAAVHNASHTLTRIVQEHEQEVSVAARAGRILVPTRSLPDDFDIPHTTLPC